MNFNCSDKLLNKLTEISKKEKCCISDIIEEAVLSYYKISVIDLYESDNYILDILNESKTLKDASDKLNISERTLYRKIKGLNIKWDKNNLKYYHQSSS